MIMIPAINFQNIVGNIIFGFVEMNSPRPKEYAMKTLLSTIALAALSSAPALAAAPKIQVFTAGAAGFHATSTLITGEKDAVLVDAQFTRAEAHRLAAEILDSGKELKTIVITHAHPDHAFGLEIILKQFPNAKAVALPEVVAEIQKIAPGKLSYWKPIYGQNLADGFTVPEALKGSIDLEGNEIKLVRLAEGESESAAAVYVPAAKTLIAGDAAFDGVHLWLAEGRPEQWLKNLETLKKVGPVDQVVPGHKRPGTPAAGLSLLDRNAAYIKDFVTIKAAATSPADALAKISAKYPDFALPIIADIAFKSTMPATAPK